MEEGVGFSIAHPRVRTPDIPYLIDKEYEGALWNVIAVLKWSIRRVDQ